MTQSVTRSAGLSSTSDGRVVPGLRERSAGRLVATDPLVGWVATSLVTLLALFLRLWHLGRPHAFEFDETYYAKDAWSLLHNGYAANYVDDANQKILDGTVTGLWQSTPELVVHPDVGKWLIASGEALFGMNPFGWRIASAVVGALMVMVMVRTARRMTGSTVLGVVGGLIMCFDGLQLVLSRLALLDIFQAFFVLCAVSCLVADRDWGRARLARLAPDGVAPGGWGPVRAMLLRPWRIASGLMWGLALGSKWSSVYVLAGFCLLVWAWDAGARRRLGVDLAVGKAAVADAVAAFGWLVVLPVVVYVATWTGWLLHYDVYERALSRTQYGPYWGRYVTTTVHGFFPELLRSLRSLWHFHVSVYDFHTHGLVGATHPYQSNPGGWLVLSRPVGVDAQNGIQPGAQGCTAPAGSTCLRQVVLLGNPAVWWAGTCAAIYAALAWVGRRDWRYGVVVVGILTAWLPWFRYDDRPIFSYYAIVIEPFLVLGLVLVLGRIWGSREASPRRRMVGAVVAGAYVVLVAAVFAWFWPIWTDQLITTPHWLQRVWFHRWI